MKKIPLIGKYGNGKCALVDNEDYPTLSKFIWFSHINGYVTRHGSTKIPRVMHFDIISAKKGLEVDHINGNKLDNRKCNLRLVTHQENMAGYRKIGKNNTSKMLGISKHENKWRARCSVKGREIYLGRFETKQEAYNVREEWRKQNGII